MATKSDFFEVFTLGRKKGKQERNQQFSQFEYNLIKTITG